MKASEQSVAMILKIKVRPVLLLNPDLAFEQSSNNKDKEALKHSGGLVPSYLGRQTGRSYFKSVQHVG